MAWQGLAAPATCGYTDPRPGPAVVAPAAPVRWKGEAVRVLDFTPWSAAWAWVGEEFELDAVGLQAGGQRHQVGRVPGCQSITCPEQASSFCPMVIKDKTFVNKTLDDKAFADKLMGDKALADKLIATLLADESLVDLDSAPPAGCMSSPTETARASTQGLPAAGMTWTTSRGRSATMRSPACPSPRDGASLSSRLRDSPARGRPSVARSLPLWPRRARATPVFRHRRRTMSSSRA
ncbi:hypothetical protein BN2537_16821 [Streptomyces venezuelae]|nr:hypothetical protein BN2537_16821 [Streptomyces venezuelae]